MLANISESLTNVGNCPQKGLSQQSMHTTFRPGYAIVAIEQTSYQVLVFLHPVSLD